MGKVDHVGLIDIIQHMKKVEYNIEDMIYSDTNKFSPFEMLLSKVQHQSLTTANAVYPSNMYEFLQLLKTPIEDWGLFNIKALKERKIPTSLVVLNERTGISDEANWLLQEYISSQEASSSIVREVLAYCRRKYYEGDIDMQHVYSSYREFLIKNPLIKVEEDIEELGIRLGQQLKNDRYIIERLIKSYERIPNDDFYVCPYCGWTLQNKSEKYNCLNQECTEHFNRYKINDYKARPFQFTHRTIEPVQLSTVIPGIKEFELKERFERQGAQVLMYPNIESDGDLQVTKKVGSENIQLKIDVINYSYPYMLVEKLLHEEKSGLLKDVLIGIPDSKGKKRYMNALKKGLMHHDLQVEVFTFSELINMVKSR